MKNNSRKLIIAAALLLIAGGLYYLAIMYLGIGIRCPFERLTGYRCPGCGITTMFINLAAGNLRGAWESNQLTFALIPFYVFLIGFLGYRFVKHEERELPKWIGAMVWVLIVAYLVFGVLRNVYGF